jgi:DNA-binding SARP family transcriptional activator
MQHRNHSVPTGWLIEELWGDSSPSSALATLQTYIYQLRKFLTAAVGPETAAEILQTTPAGYRLRIRDEDVDDGVFGGLVREAGSALQNEDPQRAVELARQALDQWRGPVLTDVQKGPLLEAYSAQLQEDRLRAIELRIDAELQLGRHRTLISELKALTISYPLNEGLHTRLMVVLYRAERRCEALETYQRLRATLIDELGLEPTAKAQRIHQAILTGDLNIGSEPDRARKRTAVLPAPAQLPPDIADFTARGHEICELKHRSCDAVGRGTLPITGVIGPPGIGKTAIAIRAARQMADRFPDAQFYQSYGCGPQVAAGEVLFRFLRATGIDPAGIPDDTEERSQLFRSWLASRRALVVLDDVQCAEQVMPLLPGSDTCAVLVTSQSPIRGLPGARYVRLDALGDNDSYRLLHQIVDTSVAQSELRAARPMLTECDGMPQRIRELGDEILSHPLTSHASARSLSVPWPARPYGSGPAR